MIYEESEDMSFRVSQLEKNFKGVVKTLDLCNMEKIMEKNLKESMEENMGNMEKRIEKKLEENMERMINLLQHKEEKLPNGDNVGQGTQDDRNSSCFEKPSFSKHTP